MVSKYMSFVCILPVQHLNSFPLKMVIICFNNLFGTDVSTDGKWCYVVFWVVGKPTTRWDLLRERLLEVCPRCTPAISEIFYFRPEFQQPKPPKVFLLKFWCTVDRKGLLHGTLSCNIFFRATRCTFIQHFLQRVVQDSFPTFKEVSHAFELTKMQSRSIRIV